ILSGRPRIPGADAALTNSAASDDNNARRWWAFRRAPSAAPGAAAARIDGTAAGRPRGSVEDEEGAQETLGPGLVGGRGLAIGARPCTHPLPEFGSGQNRTTRAGGQGGGTGPTPQVRRGTTLAGHAQHAGRDGAPGSAARGVPSGGVGREGEGSGADKLVAAERRREALANQTQEERRRRKEAREQQLQQQREQRGEMWGMEMRSEEERAADIQRRMDEAEARKRHVNSQLHVRRG
ncbi:hypothetical protein CYMTET_50424, partial [Cymbomonas tetramitiformis]